MSDDSRDAKQADSTPGEGQRERHRIDSGQTGDKVQAPDPAASPLGTDDEAAGGVPDVDGLAIARQAGKPAAV